MYDGTERTVELKCDNELMKNIIDRFGDKVNVISNDKETFIVSVTVNVSSTFFGWVLGFGGGIRIINPQDIIETYKKHLLNQLMSDRKDVCYEIEKILGHILGRCVALNF